MTREELIDNAKEILGNKVRNSAWNTYRIDGTFDCEEDGYILHIVSAVYDMDDFEVVPKLLVKLTDDSNVTCTSTYTMEHFVNAFGEGVLETILENL